MDILLSAFGDPNNPKVWSKTPFAMKEVLEKENRVKTLDISQFRSFWFKVIHKILWHIGIAEAYLTRVPLLYPIYATKIEKAISKSNCDVVIFAAEDCLRNKFNGKIRCYQYQDSHSRAIYRYNDSISFIRKWTLPLYERNDKKSLSRMSLIFTFSDWVRDCLINDYHLSPDKIKKVGFGVNLEPLMEEKDYSQNRLLIVLRKGAEKRKGLLLLLDAFKIVKQKVPDATLDVVGTEGEMIPGVTYYYNKSREVTVDLFKKCTLYTMPALYEPNGIAYLEGLANKAPIVGLNRFAVPEFSGNGKWGFIVDEATPEAVAHTIIDALSDKERLKKMGELGQDFVIKHYTWEKAVNKMLNYIKEDLT